MSTLDQWIVIVWGIAILGLGMFAGLRSSALSFWINNRNTSILLLVTTIVATQVGGGTILGIASSSRDAGTGYGLVAIVSTVSGFFAIAFLAKRILSVVGSRNTFTMPEIIGIRFGRYAQMVAGLVVVIAYISLLGGQMLATGLIVKLWSGVSFNTALIFAGAGVVLYSSFAGLKGDIVTDVAHFAMMALVLFGVFPWFLSAQVDVTAVLANLPLEAFSPIRFGGYTYLIAGVLIGAIVPLVSMEQWMRVYAANNQRSATVAYFISGILIIPFYLIPMVIGLISIHSMPDLSTSDTVFIQSMFQYLPSGVLGIGVATLFAVLISTANTMIVVLSATIFRDLLGKNIESTDSLSVSRKLTLAVGSLGVGLSLLLPDIVQLILNAFFWLMMLFPAIVISVFNIKCSPVSVIISIVLGVFVTMVASFWIPTQAFLPGLIVSVVIIASGVVFQKLKERRT